MLAVSGMLLIGCSGSGGNPATGEVPAGDVPEGALSQETVADQLAESICDGAMPASESLAA